MAKIKSNQWLLIHMSFGHLEGSLESLHNFGTLGFDLIKLELGKIS
jgi:hypothetical protein